MAEITRWVPLLGYILFFIGVLLVVLKRVAAKAGKFPLQEDVILMRRAGEGLDQRYRELMDQLPFTLVWALVIPILAALLPLLLFRWSVGNWRLALLLASAGLFLAAFISGMGKVKTLAQEARNVRLGLFGERAVADELDKLRGQGYRVFHDVPCLGATGQFNIDHVVVGKGGLAVIETKTYRKPKGTGPKTEMKVNWQVEYDGAQLIWPNRRSTEELEQLAGNSEWLQNYLKRELSVQPTAMQVLVIPGWYVIQSRGVGMVRRVMNQKQLANGINDLKGTMTGKEEDLVIRRLTGLCTDVKYSTVA